MTKSPDAFRTISEVAEELELPQHVLRFWETRFKEIQPMKRKGGRRYYRPEDVGLVRGIKGLLYDEGYTIRGVQRLLKEHGNGIAIEFGQSGNLDLSGREPEPDQLVGAPGLPPVEPDAASEGVAKSVVGLFKKRTNAQTEESLPAGNGLSKAERDALQTTLQDLLECKRLLDQTREG